MPLVQGMSVAKTNKPSKYPDNQPSDTPIDDELCFLEGQNKSDLRQTCSIAIELLIFNGNPPTHPMAVQIWETPYMAPANKSRVRTLYLDLYDR